MNLREQQLRDVKVTGIGTGEASCGRSPNLFEQVQSLMNSEFDKQFDTIRTEITTRVIARATERKVAFDVKAHVGRHFKVEANPALVNRVREWLAAEGFENVERVGDLRAKENAKPVSQRRFTPHTDPYRLYSDDTFLIEW